MAYIEKKSQFIKTEINPLFDSATVLSNFKAKASHFDRSPARCNTTKNQNSTKIIGNVLADVFNNELSFNNLTAEIKDYLNAKVESSITDILEYWCIKTSIYPSLAGMAQCYLAVPATRAPLEQVFSHCKNIVGPQHGSLSPTSIGNLLCLKEWYQSVGTLDPAPYDKMDDGFDSDDIDM
ncbi:hypothetical protein PCANC_20414 [Puccinia coronata f. sp. avenae]|uniref:HAT C-terminal dimerisation domain-containing protein n=1 Tax=Puccinia coronata f. sp. avenae TaxID=200324 RepID=A0A2N5SMY3_9BASI|nr:hypothetical protein PCANC_20414 [Puccinia coronata f. sp. avenae]